MEKINKENQSLTRESTDLLQKILECKEEEVNSVIKTAIDAADANAIKIEYLGYSGGLCQNNAHKGFIPLNTRIRYANLVLEDYGMQTTDFIYEFAHLLKACHVDNKKMLIYALQPFVDNYFGLPGKTSREMVFNEKAQMTKTDEEYFAALKKNQLGDLKGKGAALCTERSALIQQILSIFGIESYYCMGCAEKDNSQEPHCFNVVKRKNDYAVLDYSMPVTSYGKDGRILYYPFVGSLTNEEFADFLEKGTIKSFDDYRIIKGNPQEKIGTRMYVVGKDEIKKEKVNIESENRSIE